MANVTRSQAQDLLDAVTSADPKLGVKIGLPPEECEDLLRSYLDLLDKFERVTACR